MNKRLKISLYFDVISPYTYLAWTFLQRYKARWNLELELKPVFLGGIMSGSGNKPPAMLPQRGLFMEKDLQRSAAMFGAPLLPTPSNFFGKDTNKVILTWQRIFTARLMDGASSDEMERLVTKAMFAFHAEAKNRNANNDIVVSQDLILSIFDEAELANATLKRAESAEIKQKLNDCTKEALDLGAYGSPTLLVHGGKAPYYDGKEPIFVFGSDRFEQIAFMCGLKYEGANPQAKL